jgi:uncharacterized membrane protein
MREADRTAILPAHIEETGQAIAKLHAEHQERATPFQKFTEGLTDRAGRPSFMVWLMVVVAGWIAPNLAMVGLGRPPPSNGEIFVGFLLRLGRHRRLRMTRIRLAIR